MTAIYIYNIIHVTGAFAVMLAYGMLIARGLAAPDNVALRKFGAIASGIGLFLILLGGFGLMARYQYSYTNLWVIGKYILFFALGFLIIFLNRKPELGKIWFAVTLLIGALSVYLCVVKPGYA